MLTVDLEAWRRKLLTSPWVADAAMRRVLPGTVAVAIAERRPLGVGRIGSHLYLIDDRGLIIDEFGPNYAEFDLPVIDGLGTAPRDGGPLIDGTRAALAVRLLAALQGRSDLAARVSQIDVTVRYIENQKQHHRKKSFEEEFLEFLKKHAIEYDPQYVWG